MNKDYGMNNFNKDIEDMMYKLVRNVEESPTVKEYLDETGEYLFDDVPNTAVLDYITHLYGLK